MKPERELPLFITDPKDEKKKLVGMKQVMPDGSLRWFKRINSTHVMRLGQLGFDAMTFETQFAGKPGEFRVQQGDTIYTVNFETFAAHAVLKDYGHAKQWMLDVGYWLIEKVGSPSPLREPGPELTAYIQEGFEDARRSPKEVSAVISPARQPWAPRPTATLVFGASVICRVCKADKSKRDNCTACGGLGYVNA